MEKKSKIIKFIKIIMLVIISILVVVDLINVWNKDDKNEKDKEVIITSDEREIIETLLKISKAYKWEKDNDTQILFVSDSSNWTLVYPPSSGGNVTVLFDDPSIKKCFIELFGENCFFDSELTKGKLRYGIKDNSAWIMFDVEIDEGRLYSIGYDFEEKEYTLSINGENYNISREFEKELATYNLISLMESDIAGFQNDIQQVGLKETDFLDFSTEILQKMLKDATVKEVSNKSDTIVHTINNTNSEDNLNYIFPNSDSEHLMKIQVQEVGLEKMRIGRNEIFARHGVIFHSEDLQNYFESQSWYHGTVSIDDFNAESEFNEYEKDNVALIKSVEDEMKGNGTQESFIGVSGTYTSGSAGDYGVINVEVIDNEHINVAIGTGEALGYLGGVGGGMDGTIIDAYTAVVDWGYGLYFVLSWSDAGIMVVTREGSTEYDVLDAVTDNVEYVNIDYYPVS